MESAVSASITGMSVRSTAASETWRLATANLVRLRSASRTEKSQRAYAARQLASLFVYQLLREMRKTIPESTLFDGGRAQEIYEQMIDERLADHIAASDKFGLAEMIHNQLLKYD
jgi:Rod binding domain-containing protein